MQSLLSLYRIGSSVGAVVALIFANAIPLVGVLFWGWNVWMIVIVYWLENGIVGAFNVLRMLTAQGADEPGTVGWTMNGTSVSAVARASLVGFFVVHYGIFWAVHGIFVFTLPLFAGMGSGPGTDVSAELTEGFSVGAVVLAAFGLALSHGVSYLFNWLWGGEYRRRSAAGQMFAPYGRLVVLHITIIIGAMAIAMTGAPAAVVAILVVLKTAADLALHIRDHRGASTAPTSVA